MQSTFLGRPVAGDRALIMAIVNRTPDSFYDRGATFTDEAAKAAAHRVIDEGADVIDVGGVKAGPGSSVDADEEIARVVPFIEWLRGAYPDQLISVDTWRASGGQAGLRGRRRPDQRHLGRRRIPACPRWPPSSARGWCAHTPAARRRAPGPFRVNYGTTDRGVVDDVIAEVTAAAERAVAAGRRPGRRS